MLKLIQLSIIVCICLYAGNLNISISPLSLSLPDWQVSAYLLFGCLLLQLTNFAEYRRGYRDGKRASEKRILEVISNIKSKKNSNL